jgi:nucleoside diphosphate kinase
LGAIGSGSTGTQIQKALEKSPYGFPRDAVDAALIALHRLQHITATLNTVPVPPGQLDQNKIKKSEFRLEHATLTQSDRLKVRGLFNQLDIKCKKDEEAAKAPEFLSAVLQLAHDAGGDTPLPIQPATADIDDLRRLVGNEQLAELAKRHDELKTRIESWKQKREQIEKRRGSWTLAERLASHAATLPSASEALKEVAAIRDGRLLLASTDPVSAARGTLARELRAAVTATIVDHENAWSEAMATLDASAAWQQLTPDDRKAILAACEIARPTKSDTTSDEALITALDRMSLSQRRAEIDAVRSRATRALNLAAQKLEPTVRAIAIERTTLRTREDVVAWTERQQKKLLDAIVDGPILID